MACERRCKRPALAAVLALAVALVCAVPAGLFARAATRDVPAASQPAPEHVTAPPAGGEGHAATAAESEHGAGGGAHEASPWPLIGKIVNFLILVGVLVYLARTPFARYLADRSLQIRNDLVRAAQMKDEAGRQIAEIEGKLKQLPAELDALRARGRDDVRAEEARIDEAAAAERDRLLEQTRREIDLQLRVARRELVTHAADLAVQVARDRIRDRITSDDQARLVDRYLSQVKPND